MGSISKNQKGEQMKKVDVGEWLSFQYHVMSRIPLARKLAANYCPRCKKEEKCRGTYVQYCEFEPVRTSR